MRRNLDQKYNYESAADYEAEANRILDGYRQGGTLNLRIPGVEVEMSGGEQFRNDLINNPVGATTTSFADGMGVGVVSALAPEQMGALREEYPLATTIGDIGGAVTNIAGGGAILRNTVGKALPRLMGGGARGQFARNLGADVAYSGLYSNNTGGDPLTGMAWGAVGSTGGQAAARALGRAGQGVDLSNATEYLRNRNIPLTSGQTLGGTFDRIEERAASMPFVGDMIRNRRIEGGQALQREAFRDAGAPIGFTPTATGGAGITQLRQATNDAYSNMRNLPPAPIDEQLTTDLMTATTMPNVPDDVVQATRGVIDARVAPLLNRGSITGYDYQQAIRSLRRARNTDRPTTIGGYEDMYRTALSDVEGALTAQMNRTGASETVDALTAANAANRNLETLRDATNRAKAGGYTGEPYEFSPYQLQAAGQRTADRYPGPRPFADLADNAQSVMASRIPNSGTADRMAQMTLAGGALGAGGGYLSGDDLGSAGAGAGAGAAIPTIAALLLAAGGTRGGQRGINAALANQRPEWLRRPAEWTSRRAGLFGSAAMAPMVVGQQ